METASNAEILENIVPRTLNKNGGQAPDEPLDVEREGGHTPDYTRDIQSRSNLSFDVSFDHGLRERERGRFVSTN